MRDVEMENIRAWWAAMSEDERAAELMRRNPAACPCGAGDVRGHLYQWCMPHPAWLYPAPVGNGAVAGLLDEIVASLTPNCNPRSMQPAIGTLRWLAGKLRQTMEPWPITPEAAHG